MVIAAFMLSLSCDLLFVLYSCPQTAVSVGERYVQSTVERLVVKFYNGQIQLKSTYSVVLSTYN